MQTSPQGHIVEVLYQGHLFCLFGGYSKGLSFPWGRGWPCYPWKIISLGKQLPRVISVGGWGVTQVHLSCEGATQGHNQLIKTGSLSHMAIKKGNQIILNNTCIFISSYCIAKIHFLPNFTSYSKLIVHLYTIYM